MRALLAVALLVAVTLAGCASPDPSLRIVAMPGQEEAVNALADGMLGWDRGVRVIEAQDAEEAARLLAGKQADAALLDPLTAWWTWQERDAAVIAAAVREGAVKARAVAWVGNASGADAPSSLADLEGRGACHAGLLHPSGAVLAVAAILRDDLVRPAGSPAMTAAAFFGTVSGPEALGAYDESSAVACWQAGDGDVVFARGDCAPCIEAGMVPMVDLGTAPNPAWVIGDHTGPRKHTALIDTLLADDSTAVSLGWDAWRVAESHLHLQGLGLWIAGVPGLADALPELPK